MTDQKTGIIDGSTIPWACFIVKRLMMINLLKPTLVAFISTTAGCKQKHWSKH